MAPAIVHLPNGHNLSVTPVFGGLYFKSQHVSLNRSTFPPGWTVVLNEGDYADDEPEELLDVDFESPRRPRRANVHRYKRPTLRNDHIFISSISNPHNSEYHVSNSPTRQIAMMLWATLWWYFHQPEPEAKIVNSNSANTAEPGRPKGEWRININREGILKRRNLLVKLERMGIISTEDTTVGLDLDDRRGMGYRKMFVSRRAFWQLDARVFLIAPSQPASSPTPRGTPFGSRPGSPQREGGKESPHGGNADDTLKRPSAGSALSTPFQSSSHLPTFYPPPPVQYIFTNDVRHPLRPKPPRQGETFYIRYIPSLGQYLSFRVASLSPIMANHGPWVRSQSITGGPALRESQSDPSVPTIAGLSLEPTDVELLNRWMNDPRVDYFWGEAGPQSHQEELLHRCLTSKHSFPVIGSFDGEPFGFFELYWVKEDKLGRYLGRDVGDWDRGIHCLVGEQKYRGPQRVRVWLSALVHYLLVADNRTDSVMLEPRVDNTKLKNYCEDVGFHKQKEISSPQKQSNLMRIYRETWERPEI